MSKIARDRGVDVLMSNHSTYDNAFEKIAALKARKPGQPNPFVTGADTEQRYLKVAAECARAMAAN